MEAEHVPIVEVKIYVVVTVGETLGVVAELVNPIGFDVQVYVPVPAACKIVLTPLHIVELSTVGVAIGALTVTTIFEVAVVAVGNLLSTTVTV